MNSLEQELRRLMLVNEPNIASIVQSFVPSIYIDLQVKTRSDVRRYTFRFEHFMNRFYPIIPTSILQSYLQGIPFQYKAKIYYKTTQQQVVLFTTNDLESLDSIQQSIDQSIPNQRIIL